MLPLALCLALTDVSPVVGVPSALVVSKAQLHLHTVGGGTKRDPSLGGTDSQALALTPVLGKREPRVLLGKGRGKTGASTKLV